jgi:hyperosmotically inducible protein
MYGLTRILVVSILCFAASSCCWLAAGAGAGYKVGTDERSIGTQVNDAAITARIKTKLVAEKEIKSLNVDVDCVNGHVTLTGIVKNRAQIGQILEIARAVDGTKTVTSNLTVRP